MRLAFFGPLNPTRSGISDYNEELLPLLRKRYDIDVYTGSVTAPRERIYPHGLFMSRHRQNPYDLTLYQLGNSLVHEIEYGYLFRYPGAVVFHDYCLHHARAKMLLQKGLFTDYVDEASRAHPEEPRLGKSVFGGMAGDLLLYYYPFVRLVLESSLAAAAHTDSVAAKLRVTDTPVVKIPMAVQIEAEAATEPLFPGRLVVASFGLATPEKRITTVLKVLHELRWYYPSILYLIVGDVAPHYDLSGEIDRLGLKDVVEVTGHVNRDQFHRTMRRADVVVNLRYPSAGEMSATLLRALSLGKPVLMSRLPHLMEIPQEVGGRIRPDHEQDDLFHHLWQLVESASLRERCGRAARQYMEANHRPEQMVDKYVELIETAMRRKKDFRQPEMPLHLRDGLEIMRNYIRRTAFRGKDSELLSWIL